MGLHPPPHPHRRAVIAAAPALSRVAALVRASHERWDGAGYPDGLAGEAIPLGARIVAVADAFDAMTTAAPVQRPRTPDEALDELRRCAGAQFDPAVVVAFCEAWANARRPRRRLGAAPHAARRRSARTR